jgi:hypothetical protein
MATGGIMTAEDGQITLEVYDVPDSATTFQPTDITGMSLWVVNMKYQYKIEALYNFSDDESAGLSREAVLEVYDQIAK